jgi:hypothetical protein
MVQFGTSFFSQVVFLAMEGYPHDGDYSQLQEGN